MKVGDLIRINSLACGVHGFRSNVGLVVAEVRAWEGYPPDYEILIDGRKALVGFAIKDSAEVINESR